MIRTVGLIAFCPVLSMYWLVRGPVQCPHLRATHIHYGRQRDATTQPETMERIIGTGDVDLTFLYTLQMLSMRLWLT